MQSAEYNRVSDQIWMQFLRESEMHLCTMLLRMSLRAFSTDYSIILSISASGSATCLAWTQESSQMQSSLTSAAGLPNQGLQSQHSKLLFMSSSSKSQSLAPDPAKVEFLTLHSCRATYFSLVKAPETV